MRYKDMIEAARKSGSANESSMWKSIDRIDTLLDSIKDVHKDVYWEFMRKTHEDMFGAHYDREWAEWDIKQLYYTDEAGIKRQGAHWDIDEVLAISREESFDDNVTDWDKYVAYNAAYADFCRKFGEGEVANIAYLFFFGDEDGGEGKTWIYMRCMH